MINLQDSGYRATRRTLLKAAIACTLSWPTLGCMGPLLHKPHSDAPLTEADYQNLEDGAPSTTRLVSAVSHPYGMGFAKVESVSLVTGLNGTGEDPAPSPQRRAVGRDEPPGDRRPQRGSRLPEHGVGAGARPAASRHPGRRNLRCRSPHAYQERHHQPPQRHASGNPPERNCRPRRTNPQGSRSRHRPGFHPRRPLGRRRQEPRRRDPGPHPQRRRRHQVAHPRPHTRSPAQVGPYESNCGQGR